VHAEQVTSLCCAGARRLAVHLTRIDTDELVAASPAQIRTFTISQRDEFSLCTSKFESDMPSHGVGLCGARAVDSSLIERVKAVDGQWTVS
jgi:hypothetical protein